jgi:hypothetical protein
MQASFARIVSKEGIGKAHSLDFETLLRELLLLPRSPAVVVVRLYRDS